MCSLTIIGTWFVVSLVCAFLLIALRFVMESRTQRAYRKIRENRRTQFTGYNY